jgi:hypothetical protein
MISEDGNVWYPTNDKMLWSELPQPTSKMTQSRHNYNGDPKIIKQLEKIALEELRINTLKTQYSDSLDFHDVGVTSLLAALYRAYNAGFNAGTTIYNSMKYNFAKQYDASKFSWKGSEGVACASDLGIKAGQVPYDQLYDDAIDTGLTLKSPKTGVEKVFVLVGVTDFNGDLIKWSFTSVDGKLIVTIYND